MAAGIARRMRRKIELVGVFVNQPLDEIAGLADVLGLTHVQLHGDEGPSFCSAVAQRTGAKVIKAARIGARRRPARPRPLPHRLPPARHGRRQGAYGGTGHTWDWSLLTQRRNKTPFLLAGGLNPDNVAEAIEAARPVGDRRQQRRGVRARHQGPRQAARALRGGRRPLARAAPHASPRSSSTRRARRTSATPLASRVRTAAPAGPGPEEPADERRRAPLRPLRRPVRPRDARPRAGRARGGVARRPRRPVLPRRARRAAQRLRRPPVAAVSRARACPRRSATRSTSSARTSTTPARTRSTTRSARRCWPSAWARPASSPRPARARTASRPPRPARCSAWSASSTWAPRTCAARRPTCSAWSCSARAWRPSTRARGRSRRPSARPSATGSRNVGDTHYVIGSCVGPAPFPALVRDLQRIIGDEARAQILEKTGPAARPRDRLRRRRLERDRHLRARSSTTQACS